MLPLHSKDDAYTIISPRSEVMRYFSSKTLDDHVTLPEQISEGVFVAGLLKRPMPTDKVVPVRILSIRDDTKT